MQTQKVMQEHAASLDVNLFSLGVKPRRVPSSAEHLGETAVELQHEVQIDGLKSNPSIVPLAIKRAISKIHPYHVCKFRSRFGQEAIRAPEWSVNSPEPL